ncbi:mannitol-1-phosphate 5-dehydrogenase [Paenibacillus woosongensis]|uniref:Mannitol-1-phosphate 5-dehydrogenase n=1 Tax=Paenibacillus woosongensis TaxID=307580 RepID=A0ABQ4MJZ9_9BACL|nr:mannitol-1-phosphate 5-dehydrogenase [Paenibacillus woosongensis]GIP56315.1 mannitol-1-phosphate 5-dehydrogenase [Paenibacillus woosongensis]
MKAVHFGAGNIGRGFIGLLLSKSGYEVTFVDVNDTLVNLLQSKRQYTVTLANEQADSIVVDNVTAIDGKDQALVAEAVAEADIVTTAVGVSVLKHIAAAIAQGIELRLSRSTRPLHVIACENAIGGSTQLKNHVYDHLSAPAKEQADRSIDFPDAAVDRIVPLQQHEDPLLVTVEPFYEWTVDRSAMRGEFQEIAGVHYVDRLLPYIERKLFTVNTGHCIAAYHGYLSGYETIQEAMKDPAVVGEVRGALQESGAMLVRTYSFDEASHKQYIEQILERFINPYLTDEIARVGRSPIRKISPNDRLVRPARLAHELGIPVPHLTKAVAAALLFDESSDPESAELQAYVREHGVHAAIEKYTELPQDHALHAQIADEYAKLKEHRS